MHERLINQSIIQTQIRIQCDLTMTQPDPVQSMDGWTSHMFNSGRCAHNYL